EVKKSVAAHAKLAAAGIGVAKKISALGDQLKQLSQESGGGLKAEEARKSKINELHSEIFQLKKLGDSIDSGNDVDSKRIAPYVGAEEETFVFKGESPSPEEITQVIKSLGALKDEVIRFRADSLEAVDDVMVLKRLGAEKGADDKLKRLVSGKDGKNVQAGVYAAAFFRSFGYDAPELELDLILAAYLGEVSAEQVATSFPGRVAAFHGAQESGQKEMFLYDLGQAIRLARSYLDIPEAGTGKVSLDPKILAEFSKNTPRDAVDFQLLERARQGAEVPMPVPERERLVGLAESARQLIAKANLPVKVRGA
ncbi:MAG: hypothetical protein ACXWQO_17865, partial [Bdellovibrionota bacterium]